MKAGWLTSVVLLLSACGGSPHHSVAEEKNDSPGISHVTYEQPVDMRVAKADSNFLWLTNGDAKRQRNLCIYSYTSRQLDAMELLQKRDSVMRHHVKGETDSIFLVTVAQSVSSALMHEGGCPKLKLTGLWQMENDAMGGPFVCYALVDSARRRVVVADGFVYAPGRDKRMLMQRLETIVKTINIKK
ncbi:MAG: DUF4837 family protein [Prevotella sp.]|nr:DUF4837 family protein [Prevotella sp.]